MSGNKTVMTGLLLLLAAALTVGAIDAASASAHKYIVEGKEVAGAQIFSVKGTLGVPELAPVAAEIQGKISGTNVVIECKEGSMKDEIEKEGHSKKGEAVLKKCGIFEIKTGTATSLTACTVENIVLKFNDTLVTGGGISVEVELSPSSGKTFGEFEISGAMCGLKGKHKVESAAEGKGQICTLGTQGEFAAVEQFAACGATGSKELRLDGEKAGFIALLVMKLEPACPGMWYSE